MLLPKYDVLPTDEIKLRGLNETVYWNQLDRWNYDDPRNPKPPDYSLYTLMPLGEAFIGFCCIMILHMFVILTVKMWKARDFRKDENRFNKFVHILENININFPYQDWDEDVRTISDC